MQPCNQQVHRKSLRTCNNLLLAAENRLRQQSCAHFALMPCFSACLAMLAERVMSSYELLVQLPMSAGERVEWCVCVGGGGEGEGKH